jgi:cardiolipin synthase
MKYRLYTTSQTAWDSMFRTMAAAQKSIYIEMYTFLGDTQKTHDFLSLLKGRARAGVEVVVVADIFGSRALRNAVVEELREAGVEFLYFSRWFRRTHRKILVIDGRIAFTGGVNIVEETRHWLDLQIKLEGRIVRPLLKSFAYAYEMAGGRKESILQFYRQPLVQKIKSWITDNWPHTAKIYYLNNYYKKKIIEAKRSIIMVTPYLLPPTWLIGALDDACRRGVKVDILIPNNTDIKPVNKVNFLNACRLSEWGVKFYLMPIMNHAKIMLIDGEEGVIGSQNMDVMSFNWNIEAGVFFRQKNLVADLGRIVEQWKKASVEFSALQRKMTWLDWALIAVLKIFYPIL